MKLQTLCDWSPAVSGALAVVALLSMGSGVAAVQAADQPAGTGDPASDVIVVRPGADQVRDLHDCVDTALERNETLLAERLRRQELDGQMYQALSTGLPTIDAVGQWSRGRDPTFALDESFSGGGAFGVPPGADPWFLDWLQGFESLLPGIDDIPAQSFLTANLNLNWTINPLQISGAVGAANLGIERQDELILGAQQQTIDQVLYAYYSVIRSAASIEAFEAQHANLSELRDVMQLRFELGFATTLDTLQASVTLANVGPQLRYARRNLRNDGARLNLVMGLQPDQPLAIRREMVVEGDPINRERALELALQRPDAAALELFESILHRNRRAQKSDLWPYLTVFGSYGYVGKDVDTMFDKGHDSWRASVALNIPVFDGLLTKGLVKETEAQIRRTGTELSHLRRRIRVEILELLANLDTARANLAASRLNLQRSVEAFEQSLMMLELGKTDYLNVLEAEANRVLAQSNLIDANFEVLTVTSAIKRALGRSPLSPLAAIDGLVAPVSE